MGLVSSRQVGAVRDDDAKKHRPDAGSRDARQWEKDFQQGDAERRDQARSDS